jgi:serine phosphatase RsbU (regulator of sigma subunit)
MFEAARKFATRVILIHLGLLLAIIAMVAVGAYRFYNTALQRAVEETQRRQELLARQTATGIEAYYRSIISDLIVLERKEDSSTQPAAMPMRLLPPRQSATRPGRGGDGGGGNRPRGPFGQDRLDARAIATGGEVEITPTTTTLMWRLLQNRATMLFVYDPAPPPAPPGGPQIDGGVVIPDLCFPRGGAQIAQRLAKENQAFILRVNKEKKAGISNFVSATEIKSDGHLIAVPATSGSAYGDRVLLAFVPLRVIKREFFDPVNREGEINAALIESTGTATIALDERLTGTNILKDVVRVDPELRAQVQRHIAQGEAGSWVATEETKVGAMMLPARVSSAAPVEMSTEDFPVLVESPLRVLVMSPLSEAEASVRPVLRGALFWGSIISFAVVAIFASTAFQLIRSRIRLERTQRDLLTSELRQAREIQLAWLPDGKSCPAGISVAAMNLPASHISGDFYNYFALPGAGGGSKKIAVCIGDVTGHGMSAAFLMATTQLLIHSTMARMSDPGACLTEVNRQLCMQPFRGQFVTLLLLVIDPAARTVEVATAGHPGPLISSGDGTRAGVEFTPLKIEPEFLLGVVPDAVYPTQRFELSHNATMLLYTDGLVEAAPHQGEDFGAARVIAALRSEYASLQAVLDGLVTALHTHTKRADLEDDVTLVAVQLAKAN